MVMRQKFIIILLWEILLAPFLVMAQGYDKLSLPDIERLPSGKVMFVMQDSEGFLWYATDGGGLCRDDGRQINVFRSNEEHPDLLGSNTILCLAESGNRIIIGTTHGANVLDKSDYSIHRLKEVDDRRVDDILVTSNGHWWLTANKKVYEYSPDGKLLRLLNSGDKYIFRLHEDSKGRLLCTQWEGAVLRLDGDKFMRIETKWPDSVDFRRITKDNSGRLLVADGFGRCYALSKYKQKRWFDDTVLTKEAADSIRIARHLSSRPTALAASKTGDLWFSTGKDIRCKKAVGGEFVVSNTKDVSAMTFAPDGTLWLATIYGHLYRYRDCRIETDDYGSNEYGDGVTAISVDSKGRLVMQSDSYVRIYDPVRKTLRQQSRGDDGTYLIELEKTVPGGRWSQPLRDKAEHQPAWVWLAMVLLLTVISSLVCYILMLRRQRERFLQQIKESASPEVKTVPQEALTEPTSADKPENEWLKQSITQVEAHIDDESYTVEQLSKDMCMSRMTFYRKIQSATGQTPTEFMRTIRLRRAAVLLSKGHMSVTEISYATGFSSVSYFSRCFRKMFGVPPTQYCGGGE